MKALVPVSTTHGCVSMATPDQVLVRVSPSLVDSASGREITLDFSQKFMEPHKKMTIESCCRGQTF